MDKGLSLEVRKAYRLLFDYQDRILNLLNFIGKTYEMPYAGGWQKFTRGAPRSGQGRLDLWAWDWLGMYYYEFNFKKKIVDRDLMFSVFLLNDDGYYRNIKEGKNAIKNDLKDFASVESSETKLIFVCSFLEDWDEPWKDWQDPKFTSEDEGKADDKNLIFKSYSLEKFLSEESTLKALDDFSKYANQYKLPLNITNHRLNK
ncbi:hypothetical protein SAMN04487907_10450 [Zunongwangia mangrovi]|uniref:Uncharacterized protein n=1 Tax=Zunongwangia mangrovi TaxID=1334022 RepID=A0A1I1IST8_9FLAO|nr:hypothetical protein [Zunongwangia mangrovi]SFC39265.1 hypothetical protein SAMN04487907_10450 [Zunongwangia mangrovi]